MNCVAAVVCRGGLVLPRVLEPPLEQTRRVHPLWQQQVRRCGHVARCGPGRPSPFALCPGVHAKGVEAHANGESRRYQLHKVRQPLLRGATVLRPCDRLAKMLPR